MILQLAQIQALKACIISGVFKATSVQAFNIETRLNLIGLELDKNTDQRVTCLYLSPLYLTII